MKSPPAAARTAPPHATGPDAVPPAATDEVTFYRNDRTAVSRLPTPDGGTVVRKQALGPLARQRIRHERSILERIAEVDGVPRLRVVEDDALVLEDLGGKSLADLIVSGEVPSDPTALLRLALDLARITAAIHAAGVIHHDLNSANIIVRRDEDGTPSPFIVDFDLAATFVQLRPEFIEPTEIVGRLPYLAPEQTGRTGLPTDQGSDLYSLGATFYELTTGTLPFGNEGPLDLIRQILTEVPPSATTRSPSVPAGLSAVIDRLLEKEPAARYRSAAGLVHDLARLVDAPDLTFPLGERDFPSQLTPPSRPVGRANETARLVAALDRAATSAQAVLVSGEPGVGKSSLVDQLRPMVAGRGGWFITGKADHYQRETRCHLVSQILGSLGRLLLAEPQAELDRLRRSLTKTLGTEAGLVAGLAPELQAVLDIEPEEVTDDRAAQLRLRRAVAELLAGSVSAERPLVVFLDDLQWAGGLTFDLLDDVLGEAPSGLLVIGAYRPEAVDAAHPLTAIRHRWERLERPVDEVHLGNLPPHELGRLLVEMLRVEPEAAGALARPIAARTAGNPYDTVELLNALRQEGALTLGDDGWEWDDTAIRAHIGAGDVGDLLRERLDRLPSAARDAVQMMSCLAGEVPIATLAVACETTPAELSELLLPALEDGLVLAEHGAGLEGEVLRFRHDRVHEAVHDGQHPDERRDLVLAVARRLTVSSNHDLDAAPLYLEVWDLITDAPEQGRVVEVFRDAADAARRTSDLELVDRYLEAATRLHLAAGGDPDNRVARALDLARHSTLVGLGRLSDADEVYERIEGRQPDSVELAPATCLQVATLTMRHRPEEALELGRATLTALGFEQVPPERAVLEAGYTEGEAWLEANPLDTDLRRLPPDDLRVLAAAVVLRRMCTPAYFTDRLAEGQLVTTALQLWAEHGPQPELIPVMGHANSWSLGIRSGPELDRAIVKRALTMGEAHSWEPVTAHTHWLHAVILAHWHEPLEAGLNEARRARDQLLRSGEPTAGSHTFYATTTALVDCSHLASLEAETQAGLELTARLGNDQMTQCLRWYHEVIAELRGESLDPRFGAEEALAEALEVNPMAAVYCLEGRAIVAAIRGDRTALGANLEAVAPIRSAVSGSYHIARLDFLDGLWAAMSLRHGEGPKQGLQERLDTARGLLHGYCRNAPENYRHLALLLDAERDAISDNVAGAITSYDAALRALDRTNRPWHHALIAERAGQFMMAQGWERTGLTLVAEARRHYADWGARAVARAIDEAHPALATLPRDNDRTMSSSVGNSTSPILRADTIDMMAILEASQAIGSQTDPDRLEAVIVERLQSLTGATTVLLTTRDPRTNAWTVRLGTEPVEVIEAAKRGRVPLSAFRYVERTGQPLLVPDARRDDRFARDPYVAARERCSLLGVPLVAGGQLRAVLLLTHDLVSGAFTADRLDAVELVGGQLAVSLDNAVVYRSLETMVASRTEDLEEARAQLEMLSLTDPLTQVANRRQFEKVLEADWVAAAARGSWLGVVMLDIDHFKQYNDSLGHPAGDQCIRQVAAALSDAVRTNDLLARYGGEEFAVILPGSDPEASRLVAQRLRNAVVDLDLMHPSGGSVTVSLGVAAIRPDNALTPQALLTLADAALYQAKRNGRNLVELATPSS